MPGHVGPGPACSQHIGSQLAFQAAESNVWAGPAILAGRWEQVPTASVNIDRYSGTTSAISAPKGAEMSRNVPPLVEGLIDPRGAHPIGSHLAFQAAESNLPALPGPSADRAVYVGVPRVYREAYTPLYVRVASLHTTASLLTFPLVRWQGRVVWQGRSPSSSETL